MLTDDNGELEFFGSIAEASRKLENIAYKAMNKEKSSNGGKNASYWILHNPGPARKKAEGNSLEKILELLKED